MQKIHKHQWQGQQVYQRIKHKYHLIELLQYCTDDRTVDCSLLCNISSFLFFISAASLWPWAKCQGCFSRATNFLSSSVIFIWHKIDEEIRFVYIDMHVLTSLKHSWQRLIHHLLAHHFHHEPFSDLPFLLGTTRKWPWPASAKFWYSRIRLCQQPYIITPMPTRDG